MTAFHAWARMIWGTVEPPTTERLAAKYLRRPTEPSQVTQEVARIHARMTGACSDRTAPECLRCSSRRCHACTMGRALETTRPGS